MTTSLPQLSTIAVRLDGAVAEISLNRPERSNALNEAMWQELREAMRWADATPEVRAVVLAGAGKNFCAGIDLAMLGGVAQAVAHADPARSREALRQLILDLQDCLSSIEACRKAGAGGDSGRVHRRRPRHGDLLRHALCRRRCGVLGEGSRCRHDRRRGHAAAPAAPMVPTVSHANWPTGTGRNVDAAEAAAIGLVNRVFPTHEELAVGVMQIAQAIAAKSPLAIRGTKEMLNYGRDHSVADGLNHIATWNAAMLMSADLNEAMAAAKEKSGRRATWTETTNDEGPRRRPLHSGVCGTVSASASACPPG